MPPTNLLLRLLQVGGQFPIYKHTWFQKLLLSCSILSFQTSVKPCFLGFSKRKPFRFRGHFPTTWGETRRFIQPPHQPQLKRSWSAEDIWRLYLHLWRRLRLKKSWKKFLVPGFFLKDFEGVYIYICIFQIDIYVYLYRYIDIFHYYTVFFFKHP